MLKAPISWLERKVKIAVVGCGGTGSELLAKLFKINYLLKSMGGLGIKVYAFDPKYVSPFNVGRQNFWVHDIGLNKAEIIVDRYNNFGECKWKAYPKKFEVSQASKFDIVMTCVDLASFRAELGKYWSSRAFHENSRTIWIDGGNDDNSGQVVAGDLGNAEVKIPNVFDLFPSLEQAVDDPTQSCSHEESIARQNFGINANIAETMSQMLWKLIREGKLENHMSFIDLKSFDISSMPATPETWQFFGYNTKLQEVA